MTDIEQVKNEYHKEMTRLLSGIPEALQAFERAWQSGKFREAHLIVHDTVRQLDLKLSTEQEKIRESFYWLFVN